MKKWNKINPGLFITLIFFATMLVINSCQAVSNMDNKEIQGIWNPSGWSCPVEIFCQKVEFHQNGKLDFTQTDNTGRFAIISPGKIKLLVEGTSYVADYRIENQTLTLSFKEGNQEYILIDHIASIEQQEDKESNLETEAFVLPTKGVVITEDANPVNDYTALMSKKISVTLISTLDARETLEKNNRYRIQFGGDLVADPVSYFSAIFSSKADYLITSAGDNGEMVWDLNDEIVISDVGGRSFDLRISADDRFLLTETTYCSILVSNPFSLEILSEISLSEGCTSLYDLHPFKNVVAVSTANNGIALVDIESGQVFGKTPELKDYPNLVRFSGDGKWLITITAPRDVSIFDSQNNWRTAIAFDVEESVLQLEPSPTEPLFAYSSSGRDNAWNGVQLVNFLTQEYWTIDYSTPIVDLGFLQNGGVLGGLTDDGKVIFWDTYSGKMLQEISTHGKPVSGLGFSKTNSLLAITYLDGFIEIYEITER